MDGIGLEASIVLALIAVNALLAMSEIAVVSARKARLRQRVEQGDLGAATALQLAEEPTRFLSTVQVGITLVGIFAGAFGGATIADRIGLALDRVPGFAPYGHAIALAGVVAAITYLSLILGELVPKRIGLANAETVAARVAGPMRVLSTVAGPVVGLLSLSTEAVLRLLRAPTAIDTSVTEEEVRLMIAEGAQTGVFLEAEREIVESVFRFGDRRVDALMVPRPRITWLDVEDPPALTWERIASSSHTYYPVARGDLDEIVGIAPMKQLAAELFAGRQPDLLASMFPPTFVPETMTALQLLETFRGISARVALAVDEHGTIVGLVTPTDILEAIVGDLPDDGPEAEPEVVRRDDGSLLVDGLLSVEELAELADVDPEPGREQFRTVGGLVMHLLGRVPRTGDRVAWEGLRLEVVDMDVRRVDKVLVTPPAAVTAAREQAGSEPS